MAESTGKLQAALRAVNNAVYGVPEKLGREGNVMRFAHSSEESAMASVAANRVLYGHGAGMEFVNGRWETWIDFSEQLRALEQEYAAATTGGQ